MKKSNMFLVLLLAVCTLFLTACGNKEKTDSLKGNWLGYNDDLKIIWIFKDGKASLKNDYFSGDGTYEIKDDKTVIIKLDAWDQKKTYKYSFKEGKLSLISDDDYSPSYKDMEAIK